MEHREARWGGEEERGGGGLSSLLLEVRRGLERGFLIRRVGPPYPHVPQML